MGCGTHFDRWLYAAGAHIGFRLYARQRVGQPEKVIACPETGFGEIGGSDYACHHPGSPAERLLELQMRHTLSMSGALIYPIWPSKNFGIRYGTMTLREI
jgi:hypothetical protein